MNKWYFVPVKIGDLYNCVTATEYQDREIKQQLCRVPWGSSWNCTRDMIAERISAGRWIPSLLLSDGTVSLALKLEDAEDILRVMKSDAIFTLCCICDKSFEQYNAWRWSCRLYTDYTDVRRLISVSSTPTLRASDGPIIWDARTVRATKYLEIKASQWDGEEIRVSQRDGESSTPWGYMRNHESCVRSVE
jgi:hypothetical protein